MGFLTLQDWFSVGSQKFLCEGCHGCGWSRPVKVVEVDGWSRSVKVGGMEPTVNVGFEP